MEYFGKIRGLFWKSAALLLLIAVSFTGCGESGTTETIVEKEIVVEKGGMDIVASAADLPKCTADNEGSLAIVKADGLVRYCYDGKWNVSSSDTVVVSNSDTVVVSSTDTLYVPTASDYSCETKPLADGKGVAIYCGGDSIGVVLNGMDGAKGEKGADGKDGVDGKPGENGKDGLNGTDGKPGEKGDKGDIGEQGVAGENGKPGVGCSIVDQNTASVKIKCGDDEFTMNLNGSSSSDEPLFEECGEEDEAVDCAAEMSKIQISGASQKGPFTNGASVTAYELISANLKQTGNSYSGFIKSDDGLFDISTVRLASQYVYLYADGFYRNEVSGKNSVSKINLRALANLMRQEKANINLITHLEIDRVHHLVNSEKNPKTGRNYKVMAAKRKAEKEIFKAFYVDDSKFAGRDEKDLENFIYAEDMNILKDGDANGALLAISILLQGNRSESELAAILSDISFDLYDDGLWNGDKSAKTRAEIADWVDSVDLGLKGGLTLSKIESNVSGWGLGSVPAFQKYVRNFWYKEYGLGDCDESNKNVVVRDTNSKSAHYASKYAYAGSNDKKVRYACDDKDSLGRTFGEFRWRRASNIEKDTMGLKHGELSTHEQASVINGQVNTDHVYVYEGKQYRRGTALDKSLGLNGCTIARKDTVAKSGTNWYKCESQAWRIATDIEKDTAGWGHDFKTGDVRNGRVNTNLVYVYEDDNWRHGTALDSTIKTGGYACTKERLGDYFKDTKGDYHVCTAQQNMSDTLRKWVAASTLDNDTYEARSECSATGKYGDGTILDGRVNSGNKYVCDKNGFKTATANDLKAGKGCTEYTEGEYVILSGQYSYYKCESGSWNFTLEKLNYGELTYAGQTYKTVGIKTQMWMAENLNYAPSGISDMGSYAWSGCYDDDPENCEKYGRLYTWEVAMNNAACAYGKTCSPSGVQQGICPEGWHLPSDSDWSTLWTAIGEKSTAGTKLKSTSGWNSNGNGEDAYGFSVLPAGYRNVDGSFYNQGNYAGFWSSSEYNCNYAGYWTFFDSSANVDLNYYYKDDGHSVRCLKD